MSGYDTPRQIRSARGAAANPARQLQWRPRMQGTHALIEHGAVSAELCKGLDEVSRRYAVSPLEALVLACEVDPLVAAQAIATCAHVPLWLSWPSLAISKKTRDRLPAYVAHDRRAVPVRQEADGDLIVAMADPLDDAACQEVAFFAGRRILRVAVPAPMVSNAVLAFYGIETPFLRLWRILTARGAPSYAQGARQ